MILQFQLRFCFVCFLVIIFMAALTQEPLSLLMEELLQRLLDESLTKLEFGPQLLKALNILMLKILENCDKNDSFAVLIVLMRQSSSVMLQIPPAEREGQAKFTELAMKCLWKLTRVKCPTPSLIHLVINPALLPS